MSDWADNADNTYQVDQPVPDQGGDFVPTPLDSSTYDSINTYASQVANFFNVGGTDTGNGIGIESGLIARGPAAGSEISGAGRDNAIAGTGENGFLGDTLDAMKKIFGWDDKMDPRVKAAALTIGAGALAGVGNAIQNKRKLDLEEKKINTESMLAQTQADIAKQKMANQAGALTFNAPVDANGQPVGLINRVAKLTPLKNRVTA